VIKIQTLAGAGKERFKWTDPATGEELIHPTQKPLALCDKLLKSCMQPEGYVLIPFGGSGSECVACKSLNLPFVCFELNEKYITLINARLKSDLV